MLISTKRCSIVHHSELIPQILIEPHNSKPGESATAVTSYLPPESNFLKSSCPLPEPSPDELLPVCDTDVVDGVPAAATLGRTNPNPALGLDAAFRGTNKPPVLANGPADREPSFPSSERTSV